MQRIMNTGKRGQDRHEDIVCRVRQHVPAMMRLLGWKIGRDWWLIGHEGTMLIATRQGHNSKGKLPDLMFSGPSGLVMFEVGKCQIGKWGGLPMVHVSFDEEVSTINIEDDFSFSIATAVELSLGEQNQKRLTVWK